MTMMRRPKGNIPADAAAIIAQIRAYARRPASDDPEDNIDHVSGMHHIFDVAYHFGLPVTCAYSVTAAGAPGHAGFRKMEYGTGLHKDTVQRLARDGKNIIAEEAA